jgi:ubiquinone/menaquinone biosynthesis C-methylase UbiE
MSRRLWSAALACLAACSTSSSSSTESAAGSANPGINSRYATKEGLEKSITLFEEEGRERYQKPDEVLTNLEIKPGTVVCEVGAGSGYFTPYLLKGVGAEGKVIAEDPEAGFVEHMKKKFSDAPNIEVVLGTYTDTKITDGACDLVFVLDAYHHFEWPKPMLDAMRSDLKPDGRMVIIDWYRRPNEHFDRWGIDMMKHVPLDLDGVVAQIQAHGWKHVETRTFLEHQYFAVFKP